MKVSNAKIKGVYLGSEVKTYGDNVKEVMRFAMGSHVWNITVPEEFTDKVSYLERGTEYEIIVDISDYCFKDNGRSGLSLKLVDFYN